MIDAIPITQARKRLFELREKVVQDMDQIIFTHKDGNAVLISMDEWNSYQETMKLFRDKETLSSLLNALIKQGNSESKKIGEVFNDLELID
ncbi:MAG: type II toxin-antitoxin system prevent-host-death family antitoxin [Candidatus Cloacimonadota bacterium]|nr:MAG: type II toxin-antitoxin system prevent-host-death family antitoxin [Candidatus Cloacimonadota bacterium]